MAGEISYRLSLTGSTLIVTLLGESPVFYPAVLRMRSDGRWEPLAPKPGSALPAELIPGNNYELEWPTAHLSQDLTRPEHFLPVMVRYFESNGISFGQIAFIYAPPPAAEILQAGYANGLLVIAPPKARGAAASNTIRATWVLWPQEEGIAPIHKPLHFEHVQPQAQRIAWQSGANAFRINTGLAQPEAVLLHETSQGYVLQTVAGGGRQPRATWLDAGSTFYGMALLMALVAVAVLLLHLVRTTRKNLNP